MIKTVFFDIGNVLIFFSLPKMFQQLSACTGLSAQSVEALLFGTDLRERYEKGLITTQELYHCFQKSSSRSFTLPELTASLSDIFTPNTELWPVVEALKKAGLRLILLSNTSECHFNYIQSHYPILRQFDQKILSYEVGAWKPDPPIYQKALALASCPPEECFYTDDIPAFIAGARKAGLQGEIFTTVPRLKEHLASRGCDFW